MKKIALFESSGSDGEDDTGLKSKRRQAEVEKMMAIKRQRLKNIERIAKELEMQPLDSVNDVGSSKLAAEIAPPEQLYDQDRMNVEEAVKQEIWVEEPHVSSIKKAISRLAEVVWREGREREDQVLREYRKHPDFAFLLREDKQADFLFFYYKWRMLAGLEESTRWWDRHPISFGNSIRLVPPPLPPFDEDLEEESEPSYEEDEVDEDMASTSSSDDYQVALDDSQADGKELPSQSFLARKWSKCYRSRFENILRELTLERASIGNAMRFAIDNHHFSEPIADSLARSVASESASFYVLIARLYLVSDIVYNATCRVLEAWPLKASIEKRLIGMVQVFADIFSSVQSRLKAEMVRKLVTRVVDLWDRWSAFPRVFCTNLRGIFELAPKARADQIAAANIVDDGDTPSPEYECSVIDGEPLDTSRFYSEDMANPSTDGFPLTIRL